MLDESTRDMVSRTLALYGACLSDDDHIVSPTRKTGVKVTVEKKRLCFSDAKHRYGSGPLTPDAVCGFVESFWYWKPARASRP